MQTIADVQKHSAMEMWTSYFYKLTPCCIYKVRMDMMNASCISYLRCTAMKNLLKLLFSWGKIFF